VGITPCYCRHVTSLPADRLDGDVIDARGSAWRWSCRLTIENSTLSLLVESTASPADGAGAHDLRIAGVRGLGVNTNNERCAAAHGSALKPCESARR
jgi:hypothetical protein